MKACTNPLFWDVIFYEYTTVNYINHNQTLANVKIQWSQHDVTGHNDHWFDMDPSEMVHRYKPNLAIDYVALRDISPGEELVSRTVTCSH